MSRNWRIGFLLVLDSVIVFIDLYLAYIVLNPTTVINDPIGMFDSYELLITSVTLLIFHHMFSYLYKIYNKAWEYASIGEIIAIFKSVTLSIVVSIMVVEIVVGDVYFRVMLIVWMSHLILIGGSRFAWRLIKERVFTRSKVKSRALVIGAGSAGTMLVRQLLSQQNAEITPIAFIDDDIKKINLEIMGISVVGNIEKIVEVSKKYEVDRIIIAIPSLNRIEINKIFDECLKTEIKTVIMPKVEDLMLGKVSVNNFRDVDVEDLLGRDPVVLDMEAIHKRLSGKTILVTGAGGSIGSEICRQICSFGPRKILLLGHGENSIYEIDMELRKKFKNIAEIIPIIADVQDRNRIFEVVNEHRPDVVYHAAAHKHVPLMECNPKEAIKNNVMGTRNVAEAARAFGVNNFILVSTDKAVNPTNVMGSSKRIAEMVIQKLAKESNTVFAAVRFGNVLGSRGSVIPLFKKQILSGGPITVTDPNITRYFMTIPEAARLVLQAGTLARGGEIFVLDMGEPVKIVDLAKNIIRLSGYSPEEIGIEFSGLRPGEKMYEELLNEGEIHDEAIFPKIFIGKTTLQHEEKIEQLLSELDSMNGSEVQKFVLEMANTKKEMTNYSF